MPHVSLFFVEYKCQFCKTSIGDVKASGIMRLVECWVPIGKTSGILRVEDKFLYAHRLCVEIGKLAANQEPLF